MSGIIPSAEAFARIRETVRRVEGMPAAGGRNGRGVSMTYSGDIFVSNIGTRDIPEHGLFWKADYRNDSQDYGVIVPNAAGLRSIGIATAHLPSGGSGQGYISGEHVVCWYERTSDYSPIMREGLRLGTIKDEPYAGYDPFGPMRCLQIISYPEASAPGLALVRFEGI